MLRILWKEWRVGTKTIGQFQSWLILALIYFVVMAPIALAVRLFLNPLQLRGTPSWHWLPRDGKSATSLNAASQQF